MLTLLKKSQLVIKVARKTALDNTWIRCSNPIHWLQVSFARLYLPLEGEAFMTLMGKHYRIAPGYLYLVPPNVRFMGTCPRKLVKYWAHFNVYLPDTKFDFFNLATPKVQLPVTDLDFCEKLFQNLLVYREQPSPNNSAEAVSELDAFAAHNALKLLLQPFWTTMEKLEPTCLSRYHRFHRLLNYIEKNLQHELTLTQMAEFMHLNPVYLSNMFRQAFGVPLMKYCNQRRCSQAADLLKHTDLTIEEIAYRLGTTKPAAFSRMFCRHMGCPPKEYRNIVTEDI